MVKADHLRTGLLALIIIHLLIACSPTEPTPDEELLPFSYSFADLVGTWKGEAKNSSNTISFDLEIDWEGNVIGLGLIDTQLSIDSTGKVTGDGVYWFFSGTSVLSGMASWSLQLDSTKTNLTGGFGVVGYPSLGGMDVNLLKTGASFPLEASIASPSEDSRVSGIVDIAITIHSSSAVSKVEFYIDENLKSTDTSSPYGYSWDSTPYEDGPHTIEVIAYNTGNQTASAQHSVIVSNAKWEFLTGGRVVSSPAIGSDGTIYVGSFDEHKLYAINSDGTKKWEFLVGGAVESSPAIGSDGTIYVGSYDDKLYAINPDGTKKWEFLAGSGISSSPAIGSDGTIYVGSFYPDYKLYAINPDGTMKWEFSAGDDVTSSPAIGADGTIYVSVDDKLYAINPDGTMKWEFLTPGRAWAHSSPAIGSDGTIYVGYNDDILYAINPAGAKKWEFLTGGWVYSSPAIGLDGTVYVGVWDDKLYAINPDGTKKWELLTGDNASSSPAISSDGIIYFGSNDRLYAINPDGTINKEFLARDQVSSSPAIAADGTVYFGSDDGRLYAISGSGSLADTPWPMFRHDLQHTGRLE